MFYQFKKIFFIMILIHLIVISSFAGETKATSRELERIPTRQLPGPLPSAVFNQVRSELYKHFNQLSSDFRLNCLLSGDESAYYLSGPGKYDSGDDFSTIYRAAASGKFYVFGRTKGISKPEKFTVSFKIYLNNRSSDWNKVKTVKEKWAHSFYLSQGNYSYSHELSKNAKLSINNGGDLEPIILKSAFLDCNLFKTLEPDYKSRWHKKPPEEEKKWLKENLEVYAYPARSPVPQIYSVCTQPGEALHIQSSLFSDLDVKPQFKVKVMTAFVFKKDNQEWITKKTLKMQLKEGINDSLLIRPADLKIEKLEQGEYFIVYAVIDKLNKIHFFEPERFLIDNQAPQIVPVSGKEEIINPKTALNQDNPVIMQWEKLSDNFTVYAEQSDFIRIKLPANPEPIKLGEAEINGEKLFQIDNNQVKLTRQGEYHFDLYLIDQAGNGSEKARWENLSYSYTVQAPFLEITNAQTSYQSSEQLSLKVTDVTGQLKINQLRLKMDAENIDRVVPFQLPLKLEQKIFEEKIKNKISLPADLQLLNRTYDLENGDYHFNYDLNSADECRLRQLLIDTGYLEYQAMNRIDIGLALFKGKNSAFQLIAEVEDAAGNCNTAGNTVFNGLIHDGGPCSLSIAGQELPETGQACYNLKQALKIKLLAPAAGSYDLKITSKDLADSSNNLNLSQITERERQWPLLTDQRLTRERLTIEVTLNLAEGAKQHLKRTIVLYNDTKAPQVTLTASGNGYLLSVSDDSNIDLTAVKYAALSPENTITTDWLPLPYKEDGQWQLNQWSALNREDWPGKEPLLTLQPGQAACVYAVDCWGNSNEAALKESEIQVNHLPGGYDFILNNKQDLINCNWTVYGRVLLRCNLDLAAGETMIVKTQPDQKTIVYCDSSALAGPLKIRVNGTVQIKAEHQAIEFAGSGSDEKQYKWFGFQILSGQIDFSGSHPVCFSQATAPLSYQTPAADIVLSNLVFERCLIGIHFIDAAAAYHHLTLNQCLFKNLVYGVKFEILPRADIGSYTDYLTTAGCTFQAISRGRVYWQSVDVK